MTALTYKQHLKKAKSMLAEQRVRATLGYGFVDFFNHYVTLSSSLEFEQLAKTHLIGLYAATLDLNKTKSQLGYFNEGFERASKTVAHFLTEMTLENPPEGALDLITKWSQVTAVSIVSFLEWAKLQTEPDKQDPYFDFKFRNELLLWLLFEIQYPKICFKMMGEVLDVKPNKLDLFVQCFETITYTFALAAMKDDDLIEIFSPYLRENLDKIVSALKEVPSEFSPFIEQLQVALIKNDYRAFQDFWKELLDFCNYPEELFQQDIENIKSLFNRINIAFQQSKINKNTTIQLVG